MYLSTTQGKVVLSVFVLSILLAISLVLAKVAFSSYKKHTIKKAREFVSEQGMQSLIEDIKARQSESSPFPEGFVLPVSTKCEESLKLYNFSERIHEFASSQHFGEMNSGEETLSQHEQERLSTAIREIEGAVTGIFGLSEGKEAGANRAFFSIRQPKKLEVAEKYDSRSRIFLRDGYKVFFTRLVPSFCLLKDLVLQYLHLSKGGLPHEILLEDNRSDGERAREIRLLLQRISGTAVEMSDNFAALLYLEKHEEDLENLREFHEPYFREKLEHFKTCFISDIESSKEEFQALVEKLLSTSEELHEATEVSELQKTQYALVETTLTKLCTEHLHSFGEFKRNCLEYLEEWKDESKKALKQSVKNGGQIKEDQIRSIKKFRCDLVTLEDRFVEVMDATHQEYLKKMSECCSVSRLHDLRNDDLAKLVQSGLKRCKDALEEVWFDCSSAFSGKLYEFKEKQLQEIGLPLSGWKSDSVLDQAHLTQLNARFASV